MTFVLGQDNKRYKYTVKISYSSMNNISSIILGHNKNLLYPQYGYSLWLHLSNKRRLPLTTNIIYWADVQCEANNDCKSFLGVAQAPFKDIFCNHNRDLNRRQYIKSAELSKYICLLEDAGTLYIINWSIIAKVKR